MTTSVGLDLGFEWIKAVAITQDLKLLKIGKIKVPRNTNKDEKELYVSRIKQLFRKSDIPRDNVTTNIRGSYILARTYLPPSSNKDNFEQWFVDSIESIIPGTPIEDVVYSYELLASGRALIAFARRTEIEKQLEMLKTCTIEPVLIDASCLALYDAFATHPWVKKKNDIAIIDIGYYRTGVLMIKSGEAFSSNTINYGGKDLIKGKERFSQFALCFGDSLEKLFDYYEKKDKLRIQNIIITGSYSTLPKLGKNLKTKYGYCVELGNPFSLRKIALPKKHKKKDNPIYAQAFGLALKGLTKKGIDLLPHEVKESYRLSLYKEKKKRVAKVNVLFAGLASAVLILLLILVLGKNRELAKQVTEAESKRLSLIYVSSEQGLLTNKILTLKKLHRKKIPWSKVLYDLGASVPRGIYFKEITTESRLVTTGTKVEKKIRVVVEGNSQSQRIVLDYIKNLEQKFEDIVIENIKGETRCEFKISLGI